MRFVKSLSTLVAAAALLIGTATATPTPPAKNDISSIYEKYKAQPGFVAIELPGILFNSILKSDEDMDELTSSIDFFQMLVYDKDDAEGEKMIKAVDHDVEVLMKSSKYSELMTIVDEDQTITFRYREVRGKVTELFMLGHGKDGFVLMTLTCDMSRKDIKRLCKNININKNKDQDTGN